MDRHRGRPTGVLIAALSAAGLLLLILLFFAWAALAGYDLFGAYDPMSISAETEVHLTADQPAMAVEFKGTIKTYYAIGIVPFVDRVHPGTTKDMAAFGSFSEEHWTEDGWVPLEWGMDVYDSGGGTYRFRWILELPDDVREVTIPVEARFFPSWGDGSDMPPPDESDVDSVSFAIVDVYPATRP